ncbi:MAG: zinc-dependent metalloprotease family protein, partial [Thermoanaerobaculia bacterium]
MARLESLLSGLADKDAPPVEVALPLPDGGEERFLVTESPVIEPGLAARYPRLRSFAGQGLDRPAATVRFSWTPRGLDALVLAPGKSFFVTPYRRGDRVHHLSYDHRDVPSSPWDCHAKRAPGSAGLADLAAKAGPYSSGRVLRIYRLALAATGELTGQLGGTVDAVLSAFVAKVVEINAIFEREFAIRFVLVSANDRIIFQNPATDGYGESGLNLDQQNQLHLDERIGPENYDIGHLITRLVDGGGAVIGTVCSSTFNAWGFSGFDTQILVHEIGHHLGMGHTWNSLLCAGGDPSNPDSQWSSQSAYEPGGGATIMRYPCGTDSYGGDLLQFHVHSFDQVLAYVSETGR